MKLKYLLIIFKSLTFRRLINVLLIQLSFLISRITRKSIHWGKPISISIEPTTSCNLSCPECPSGLKQFSRPTGKITIETLDKILAELSKTLLYITFYFQGEPLLHSKFAEMVKKIKDHNILVGTSTNAHYLNEETSNRIIESKLDRLIVSLDALDAETYTKYRRGGNFDLVIENLKKLVEIKKRKDSILPFIELQFIVFKHNQHQIDEIKKFGKDIGVNKVTIKTAQVYNYEGGNDLIPDVYSRYQKDETGKFEIKNSLPNHCFRMWSGTVFTWDGRVVPCCFDKDAQHQFGKIGETNFSDIWNSKQYNLFRNQLLKDRKQIEICRNCSEGMK